MLQFSTIGPTFETIPLLGCGFGNGWTYFLYHNLYNNNNRHDILRSIHYIDRPKRILLYKAPSSIGSYVPLSLSFKFLKIFEDSGSVPAILITGGYRGDLFNHPGGSLQSAEIYLPSSSAGCSLPLLPEPRHRHSQAQ